DGAVLGFGHGEWLPGSRRLKRTSPAERGVHSGEDGDRGLLTVSERARQRGHRQADRTAVLRGATAGFVAVDVAAVAPVGAAAAQRDAEETEAVLPPREQRRVDGLAHLGQLRGR